MRKIKNFKLAWRVKEILRRARKAGLPPAATGLDGEDAVAAFLAGLTPALRPAVVFDSFGAQSEGAALAPLPGLACSLGLATLGAAFDEAVRAVAAPPRARLAALAGQAALDQALQFAGALVAEEAAAEKCELSPLQPLTDAAALAQLLELLDGSKIGVTFRDGRLAPACSAAFSISWIAKPRSRSGR